MRRFFGAYSPYFLLTLAIMLPLLLPGYVLTMDLVFTPELRAPVAVTNDWFWQNFLHYLNFLAPSQLIEKVILLSIPLLSAIGMHQLISYIKPTKQQGLSWYWPTYIAGIFYAVNPFTYSRFMAGHYAVLLGYALMPFFVRLLLEFLDKPSRRSAAKTTALTLLMTIISIHSLGEIALVGLVLSALALWRSRGDKPKQRQIALLGLTSIGMFVVLSSYWLLPLALGHGDTARIIQNFNSADTAAFATTGGNKLVQLSNIFRLQGFWADAHGLYKLPQDQFVGWGTIRLAIWALVAWGVVWAWKTKRGLAAALLLVGLINTIVALGIPQGTLTALGYREPQKFVSLLALVFAIFIAFGSAQILAQAEKHSDALPSIAAMSLLTIVLIFTPTMYWGFARQLTAADYPRDWYRANEWLNRDPTKFKAVALPWHEYMTFNFARRIVGNPAQEFFDKPVLISNNPEIGQLTQPQDDQLKIQISNAFISHDSQMIQTLAKQNIKYFIVMKDYDYRKYNYLDHQAGLAVVWDSSSIKIYRNLSEGGVN